MKVWLVALAVCFTACGSIIKSDTHRLNELKRPVKVVGIGSDFETCRVLLLDGEQKFHRFNGNYWCSVKQGDVLAE